MELIYTFLVLILGLCVGSFVSALTYRAPRGISIAKGRSFCPHCKAKISWYDNIPLFSFLFLRGKCRNCGKKISLRYPFIEGAIALGFLYIYSSTCSLGSHEVVCRWNESLGTINLAFLFFVFSLLVAIFVIDLERQIIPDNLVFILFSVTTLFLLLGLSQFFFVNFLTGFLAATFLLLLFLITKGKGMGLGDVKFAVFAGVFLGWPQSVTWLFASFLIGAFVGLALILLRKASFGKHIPFGPFLVVSFFIAAFYGERILKWLNF